MSHRDQEPELLQGRNPLSQIPIHPPEKGGLTPPPRQGIEDSHAQRLSRYRWLLRSFSVLNFGLGGLVFFFSSELIYALNWFPAVFQFGDPITVSAGRLWSIPVTALLLAYGLLSWMGAQYPSMRSYVWIQVLLRLFCAGAFLSSFNAEHAYWIYLLAAGLDLAAALLLCIATLRIQRD